MTENVSVENHQRDCSPALPQQHGDVKPIGILGNGVPLEYYSYHLDVTV